MADDDENSILNVELATLLPPGSGKDPERSNQADALVESLLTEYTAPHERFWFVAQIIDWSRGWKTYGQRNRALNTAAEALGLDAHPMREGSQTDLYCMTIGFCLNALGMLHMASDMRGYLPEDSEERELFVSRWLTNHLNRVHPAFAKLTVDIARRKIRGTHKNQHVRLASNLALAVGLSKWQLTTLQDAYKTESRKLRG